MGSMKVQVEPYGFNGLHIWYLYHAYIFR